MGDQLTSAAPPAILLGGEHMAVAAARSLGRAGIDVCALGHQTDPVRHSRHCTSFIDVGAGVHLIDRYLAWLESGPRAGVIIPGDDAALEMVGRQRGRLLEWGYLPVEANDEVMVATIDKQRTQELAAAAGVPVPHTVPAVTKGDLAATWEFGYPCVLKPLNSHIFASHFGVHRKLLVVHDPDELNAAYARTSALGVETCVTEIIPGGDDQLCSYYSYLDETGRPLFHLTKRKIRQWPNTFGLGCYQVTDWNPEVAEVGLRFFQGAGIRGLANVEFKRDARDGQLKLIECNHRLTAATEQLRIAGMDLPLLLYRRVTGGPLPQLTKYRTGIYFWHPVEDVMALRAYRGRGELTVWRWARSLLHRQHFPLLSADDPMPALRSFARRLLRLSSKLIRRR